MKQKFDEYYIGLDIGTNSVGWAVTDLNYNVLRFNKKSMWGVRLFQNAKTSKSSKSRRIYRGARRRLKRRKYRINLLQELFASEIHKVDPGFFQRLEESKYHYEDRELKNKYTLFIDKNYTDKTYFKDYPTIFHLRKALIDNENINDVRLLYLAIHNIIKKRGHFIFEGEDFSSVNSIDDTLENFKDYMMNELGKPLSNSVSNSKVAELIKDKLKSNKDKVTLLQEIFNTKDKSHKAAFTIMVGNQGNFKDLFSLKEHELSEKKAYQCIKFSGLNYDEKRSEYEEVLGEKIKLIEILKSIYDWKVLSTIRNGEDYISFSMVDRFEEHKKDLNDLKNLLRKYSIKNYKNFFNNVNNKTSYASYISHEYMDTKTNKLKNSSSKGEGESFYNQDKVSKIVSGILNEIENKIESEDLEIFSRLKQRADDKEIFPKQRVSSNGVIPYQFHKMELEKILDNYKNKFEFLNEKDDNGISVAEKIVKLLTFRIPYYVGPLNNYHSKDNGKDGFSWVVRKEKGRVTPWNFEEKVDENASAEKFITRMTNKCKYLVGEDVLPKDSLLYSEYKVLNEINNIKLDGVEIPVELKQEIFNELMMFDKKVTIKKLRTFLKHKQFDNYDKVEITGIDNGITSSLKTHIYFENLLEGGLAKDFNKKLVENVIRWKCLYGEDKKIFKNKLKEVYGSDINDKLINDLSKLKYSGWGRLSRKFLLNIEGVNKVTGEHFNNIMEALYKTNNNKDQLLSIGFTFKENIEKENIKIQDDTISYSDLIDELYLPANIKRSFNQTVKILEEIKKITGREPNKIFVEVARGSNKNLKGKRTESRKDLLQSLYKDLNISDTEIVMKELEGYSNDQLRAKKLFLYFKQLGKCMYSGERISIDDLFRNNIYDIDHIYPQSKIKDDSFDNLVLVKKTENQRKSNELLSNKIVEKMQGFWKILYSKKLISQKKFNRLNRREDFSTNELADFISRQLVETRQSTKAISRIVPRIFPNSDIIYLKANISGQFRQEFDFIKVREMNNLHHAYDAYMAIVVGNVHDVKFTRNPINFIENHKRNPEKYKYSLNKMFDFDVKNNNIVAWEAKENKSKDLVLSQLSKNDVNVTEMTYIAHGSLFNETKLKKSDKYTSAVLPLNSHKLSDTSKYGAYNNIKGAYFFVVEHTKKKKRIKTIEILPIYYEKNINNNADLLKYSIDSLELNEPKIIVNKLPYYSKLIVDGYPCILTGKSSKALLVKNTKQLIIDKKYKKILKDVISYISLDKDKAMVKKKRIDNEKRIETNEEASNRFGNEMNDLYSLYKDKLVNGVYKRRSDSITKQIVENENIFVELGLYEKATVLKELTKLFSNIGTTSINLLLLNGSKNQGKFELNKNIINNKVIIVNESVTGLFVNKKEI